MCRVAEKLEWLGFRGSRRRSKSRDLCECHCCTEEAENHYDNLHRVYLRVIRPWDVKNAAHPVA